MILPLTAVHAQAAADPTWRYSLGLGVYGTQSPFQTDNDGTDSGALPWFSIESQWITIDPTALAIGLVRQDHLQIDALLAPRWLTADPSDNRAYKDIDRENGVDAGVRIASSVDRYTGTLELKSDVSDTSKGAAATFDLGARFNLMPKLSASIKAGAAWHDADLSTYEYGILPDEARAGRQAFALDSTLTPFAGLQLSYAVTTKVTAVLAAQADFLPEAITDSPLVERDRLVSSFVSLNYSF